MNTIDRFEGDYRWLSNFYPAVVEFEGEVYPSVEHAYQSAKTLNTMERAIIAKAPTAGLAKKLGRKVKVRQDWESVKVEIMLGLLRSKFNTEEFKPKLLSTAGLALMEGNYWHDCFWGSCICSKCMNMGRNQLGVLLMQVRDELAKS